MPTLRQSAARAQGRLLHKYLLSIVAPNKYRYRPSSLNRGVAEKKNPSHRAPGLPQGRGLTDRAKGGKPPSLFDLYAITSMTATSTSCATIMRCGVASMSGIGKRVSQQK